MFTLNQQVICIDNDNQPTLQEGMGYTVREVGERGIRVRSATGDIRYEFTNSRFRVVEHWEAAPVVAVAAAMPMEVRRAIEMAEYNTPHPIDERDGILIVDDLAYRVSINASVTPDVWELRDVVHLNF